ncbi:MAG: hypothetical protein OEZ37_05030, partial [Gemmatimonadota bacterium]|nr:hypothetical protein [Gemmatimonadota bacterium]
MATGMKWWLGVTLTGMALTGYALLPPDGPAPPRPDRTTPEEAEASRILRETQEISAVLQRLRWMDSIPSMVVERSAHPGGFFVTAPEWAEPEDVETIRNEVAEEMARLPRLDPSMTVALVVQDRAHGTAPGMVPTPGSRVEVYAGFLHDRAYCVVLALVTRGPPSSSILPRWTRGNIERNGGRVGMLDACRVYAAFGPPGEHVDTWLRTGGVAYATLP